MNIIQLVQLGVGALFAAVGFSAVTDAIYEFEHGQTVRAGLILLLGGGLLVGGIFLFTYRPSG